MHSKWKKLYLSLGLITFFGVLLQFRPHWRELENEPMAGLFWELAMGVGVLTIMVGLGLLVQSLINIITGFNRANDYQKLCSSYPELEHSHRAEVIAERFGVY